MEEKEEKKALLVGEPEERLEGRENKGEEQERERERERERRRNNERKAPRK